MADMADRGALVKSFGAVKEIFTNALLMNPMTHTKVIMSNILSNLDRPRRARRCRAMVAVVGVRRNCLVDEAGAGKFFARRM